MATTTAGEEFCDVCGAFDPTFDKAHGFYTCKACKNVWAYYYDDPDYNEVEEACPACDGTGRIRKYGLEDCLECDGSGVHH